MSSGVSYLCITPFESKACIFRRLMFIDKLKASFSPFASKMSICSYQKKIQKRKMRTTEQKKLKILIFNKYNAFLAKLEKD